MLKRALYSAVCIGGVYGTAHAVYGRRRSDVKLHKILERKLVCVNLKDYEIHKYSDAYLTFEMSTGMGTYTDVKYCLSVLRPKSSDQLLPLNLLTYTDLTNKEILIATVFPAPKHMNAVILFEVDESNIPREELIYDDKMLYSGVKTVSSHE